MDVALNSSEPFEWKDGDIEVGKYPRKGSVPSNDQVFSGERQIIRLRF